MENDTSKTTTREQAEWLARRAGLSPALSSEWVIAATEIIEAAFDRGRERGFSEGKEWARQLIQG